MSRAQYEAAKRRGMKRAEAGEAVANADRELLAQWMLKNGYATGHGDTVADLLGELDAQYRERLEYRDRISTMQAESLGQAARDLANMREQLDSFKQVAAAAGKVMQAQLQEIADLKRKVRDS